MASDNEDNESGQQTNRTGKTKQKKQIHHGNDNKTKLEGDIKELGSKVFTYGHRNQGDWFIKTREAIGDYVGREISKEMRILVVDGKETPPQAPAKPMDDKDTLKLMEYKSELNRYFQKKDKYEEDKAKVFVMIKGQCSMTVKNKLENDEKDYKQWEQDDDVIKLLEAIKQMSFTTVDVKDEYWTMATTLKNNMQLFQGNKESLVSFYKRFKNTTDVTETMWGKLLPTKKVDSNNDEDTVRNKFLACVFLNAVDKKRYGVVIRDLNNNHLAGVKNYPKTVEAAVTLLSNYMEEKPAHYKNGLGAGSIETNFAQDGSKKITCYECGEEGHYSNNCPNKQRDDTSTIATSASTGRRSTTSRRSAQSSNGRETQRSTSGRTRAWQD